MSGLDSITYAPSTPLSRLSEHDWRIAQSRWSRGCDWYIRKVGRKWEITLFDYPQTFTTKRAAIDFADSMLLSESRIRMEAN